MSATVFKILKFINKIAFQKIVYSLVVMVISTIIAKVFNDLVYILVLLGVQVVYAILNVKSISIITSNQLTQRDTLKYLYNLPLSKYEAPSVMAYQSLISLVPLLFPLLYYFIFFDYDRDAKIILAAAVIIPILYISISFISYKRRTLKNYEMGFQQQLTRFERYARNLDIGVKYFVYGFIVIMGVTITSGAIVYLKVPFKYALITVLILTTLSLLLYFVINIDERKYLNKLKKYNSSKVRLGVYHLIFIAIFVFIRFQTTKFYRGHKILRELAESPEQAITYLENNKQFINYKNRYGVSPIMMAIYKGDYDLYKELIELGANPKNQLLRTGDEYNLLNALTLAVAVNNIKIVQDLILFQEVSPIFRYKKTNNYALHLALDNCERYKILAFLLSIKSMNQINNKAFYENDYLDFSLHKGCLLNAIVLARYFKASKPELLEANLKTYYKLEELPKIHQKFLYFLNEL